MKIIFLIFLSFSPLTLLAQKVVGFDDLKEILIKSNQEFKGAQLNQSSAEVKKGALTRSFLPKLNLEVGREQFTTGPYQNLSQPFGSATVSMNLYNGGKDNLRNDIIGSEINLAKSQSDITKINLLSDVRSHYWNSVYQNEVTEILNLALSSNDKNLTAAKKKIRAGLSTSTDALDFEQFKLQVMQLFERSKVTAENLKAKLQATLGLEISDLQLKDQSVPHLHHDVLLATDLKLDQHREIQLLEAEKSRLKNEQKIQKRWWTPELNLYSSFAHFTQKERDYPSKEDRDDKTVGLVLKMNLFDGGEAYNQAKSSALKTQGLEYYQEQKRKELQVTFENAKRTLKLTHDLVHFAEENVSKTQTYLNRILDEYQRGIKNSPDVLQASSRLVESKIKFAELRRDYQLARVECLSVLGE